MGSRESRVGFGRTGVARPRSTLSDGLIRDVLDLIRGEDLKPGDRLPTVRDLAERFSVAAPTMREALRRLQASGVLELRHGSGTYVRNGQERVVVVNPNHGELEPDRVLDLLEARLLIEPHLASMATREADREDITRLEQILREAEQHINRDDVLSHRANASFHCAIANFSRNLILAQVIESLMELYSSEQLTIISFYEDRSADHEEHLAILAAIRNRDEAQARELMRQHILGLKSLVEDRFTTMDDEGGRQLR